MGQICHFWSLDWIFYQNYPLLWELLSRSVFIETNGWSPTTGPSTELSKLQICLRTCTLLWPSSCLCLHSQAVPRNWLLLMRISSGPNTYKICSILVLLLLVILGRKPKTGSGIASMKIASPFATFAYISTFPIHFEICSQCSWRCFGSRIFRGFIITGRKKTAWHLPSFKNTQIVARKLTLIIIYITLIFWCLW